MKFTIALSLLTAVSSVVAFMPFPQRLTLSVATAETELTAWDTKIQVGFTGSVYLSKKGQTASSSQPPFFSSYQGINYNHLYFAQYLYLTVYLNESDPVAFESKERCPSSTRAVEALTYRNANSKVHYTAPTDAISAKWKACLGKVEGSEEEVYVIYWDGKGTIKVGQENDTQKCIKIDLVMNDVTATTRRI